MKAVAELEPLTIFHEPINIRAENVARIESEASAFGISLKTDVFESRESWQDYAIQSLKTVERLAAELGIKNQLHLWPDKSLGNRSVLERVADRAGHLAWLQRCWGRVSEWPSNLP